MKGLLRKELYIWARSRSALLITAFLFCLFNKFTSGYVFALWIATMSLARAFLDDEASKWTDYSHALPYKTVQIVSSRYLFILAEVAIHSILIIVTAMLYIRSIDGIGTTIAEYFPYLSDNWVMLSNMTLLYTVWLLGIALSMPLNYKLKGITRGLIGSIPSVLSAICCTVILLYIAVDPYLISDTVPKIFYNEKWVFAACAAAVILEVAASWILCIIFADNSKKRTGKLIAPAAILAAALVALTAFSLTNLYSKGYFEKEDYATKYEKYYGQFETEDDSATYRPYGETEVTDAHKECREKTLKLMDSFCTDNHLGRTRQDLKEEILAMGYYDTDYFGDEFHSVEVTEAKEYVAIRLYTSEDTDMVTVVDISADVGQFYIESATTSELEAIGNQFTLGMSQAELHKAFKNLEIVPKHISERYFDETQHTLYYNLTYTVGNYNNEGGIYYSINIDVTDGTVSDIRIYYN